MSIVLKKRKFTQQPQYPAPIDREGLGKGAQFIFNPAVGPVDQVTGRKWTYDGDAKITLSPHGKVLNFDGVGDHIQFTGYPEFAGNVGSLAVWLPRVGNPDAFGHIYLVESTGVVYHQFASDGNIYFGGVAGTGFLSNWFNTVNRSFVLTCNGTAASAKLYVDGRDTGITWGSAPGAWPTGNKQLLIGGYTSSGFDVDGSILCMMRESRHLTQADAQLFHESKGRTLFKATPRRLWSPAASAGGGSTVTFRSTLSVFGSRSGSRQVHR